MLQTREQFRKIRGIVLQVGVHRRRQASTHRTKASVERGRLAVVGVESHDAHPRVLHFERPHHANASVDTSVVDKDDLARAGNALERRDPANPLVEARNWVRQNAGVGLAEGALEKLLLQPLDAAESFIKSDNLLQGTWQQLVQMYDSELKGLLLLQQEGLDFTHLQIGTEDPVFHT